MSGTTPNDPQDRDTRAAEYVLGLLDAADAAAAARDPTLQTAILDWSERLEPLSALSPPAAPSDMLWQRIARDVRGGPAVPDLGAARDAGARPPAATPAPRSGLAWRVASVAGFALAACLAGIIILSGHRLDVRITWDAPQEKLVSAPAKPIVTPLPPAPPAPHPAPPIAVADRTPAAPPAKPPPAPSRAVALLDAPGRDQVAMKAVVAHPGIIRIEALQTVSVPADKELAFWVWPREVAEPIYVGRITATGGELPFPYQVADGTPVMVTLESVHVDPTGQRGPTLFQGALALTD
jgi:anti-sigma-K factor RskA